MDVSVLHSLTEDFAAFLSEVTHSDLSSPVPYSTCDIGDLYLHLVDQHHNLAAALGARPIPQPPGPHDRQALDARVDPYGGVGLEAGYRRSAQLMENAFAATTDMSRRYQVPGFPAAADIATLYEEQIRNTVIHTWDIAQALGFSYQPACDVALRILRTTVLRATPQTDESTTETVDGTGVFASVLTLSGRRR
ncbi:maleylpyruvate isomerase family mycothiol-dependent enzyme [Nocardia sp. R7R-8]|uniref:maleylpyruvate isomerase family mycothiol-dependent enzyme n=1 Tax=Nocardia sp. R7R-8 TaxID=3459304 RepID=UPI00403DD845